MEIQELLRILRNRWRIVAICTLLSTSVALAWSLAGPMEYTAKGRVMIATYGSLGTAVDAYSGERVAQLRAPTYAQLIEGSEVASRAAHALGGRFTPELIRDSLDAQISAAMPMLVVSVTAATPDDAVRILSTVQQVFKQYVAQLEQPGRDGSLTGVNLTSDPPEVARVGDPFGTAMVAGLCGLVAGTLVALYRDRTDEVIRNGAQIVRVCPPYRGVVASEDGTLRTSHDTFRRIAVQSASDGWRGVSARILVTGVDEHSDAVVGSVARGFASGLAAYGRTVTLVWGRGDGAGHGALGFTDVLAGESSWDACIRSGGAGHVDEVGVGTKDDDIDALILKRSLDGADAALQTAAEHTVVAAAPLLRSPSAIAIATQVDSCLVVVTLRQSLLSDLTEVACLAHGMGIPVLGVIAVDEQQRMVFRARATQRQDTASMPAAAPGRPVEVEAAVR